MKLVVIYLVGNLRKIVLCTYDRISHRLVNTGSVLEIENINILIMTQWTAVLTDGDAPSFLWRMDYIMGSFTVYVIRIIK